MTTTFTQNHFKDANRNPAGGSTFGTGFAIAWQNGPLGKGITRKEPNGAFVEDVIAAAIGRLEFYQSSMFACPENAKALGHLREAARVLHERTAARREQGVEGTHEVHKFRSASVVDPQAAPPTMQGPRFESIPVPAIDNPAERFQQAVSHAPPDSVIAAFQDDDEAMDQLGIMR